MEFFPNLNAPPVAGRYLTRGSWAFFEEPKTSNMLNGN
jgi:hypothetical protein